MTAESTQTAPRSRRALLAGAIGGLGVWAASAIGRAAPAEAAAGDPIRMGQVNGAARTTTTLRSRTKEAAAFAVRQFGQGPAISGVNARPQGINAVGVYGASDGLQSTGVVGSGTFAGVFGTGGSSGVLGSSVRGIGVRGGTDTGTAVFAHAAHGDALVADSPPNGWAGLFRGKVSMSRYLDIGEDGTPGPPPIDIARIFVRDNAGKTQLCVRFATGPAQIIATEP